MNLAETMTNQQPTNRQKSIYQQVQYYAPVIEDTLSLNPVRLQDSASEDYLVAQTELKTESNKKLWLISSLPQFSNHVFLGLCDQDADLISGLLARLDAQSEVNDKIRAGFFGGINLQLLNQKGWHGFFIIPVNKWLSQFPTVIADVGPVEVRAKNIENNRNIHKEDSTESNYYSLVVLLTKDELTFARQEGNRKLYQRIKKTRLTPYYVNTSIDTPITTEKHTRKTRNQYSKSDPNTLRQDIIQRRPKPGIKPTHLADQPASDKGSAKEISVEVQESEFPLNSKKDTALQSKTKKSNSSNISAYQRLVGDLRTEIYMTTSEPNELNSDPNNTEYAQKNSDAPAYEPKPSLLFSFSAKLSKLWPSLALKLTSLSLKQQSFLPNIPLRLQIIGETLSGGAFAIGGFIACIFLIGKGHISASLFSAIFTFAGIMMLTDAYRMSQRINNN